jgi:hypothetical protein
MTSSSKNGNSDHVRLLLIDDEKDFVNILSKRINEGILMSRRRLAVLRPFRRFVARSLMWRYWT